DVFGADGEVAEGVPERVALGVPVVCQLDDGGRVLVAVADEREREATRLVILAAEEPHAEDVEVELQGLLEIVHAQHGVEEAHAPTIAGAAARGNLEAMRDANEQSITEAVLARLAGATSARVRQISEALVRHLHAFAREVSLTEEEWAAGIDFLTRAGKLCDDKRQELILLSDVLGVSTLVDAIAHRGAEGGTETTVLGPFYVAAGEEVPLGANLAAGLPGVPMIVTGTVSAVGGGRLAGAEVDVWQSDAEGFYDVQRRDDLVLRGQLRTDAEGRFWFWSV